MYTYSEYQRFFDFSAPQAKIFQKIIKINDFFIKIVFSWVYLIYFLSNIFIIMKKFKKWSKISKFSKFSIIHFKNNEKKIHEKIDFWWKFSRKSNSEVSPEFKNDVIFHVGPFDQKLEVRTNINYVPNEWTPNR